MEIKSNVLMTKREVAVVWLVCHSTQNTCFFSADVCTRTTVKVHVKVIPCRDKKTDRKKERMRERDMLETHFTKEEKTENEEGGRDRDRDRL